MSNRLFRHQQREEEEKRKEVQKKIDALMTVYNQALLKYNRSYTIYIAKEKMAILAKIRVKRADQREQRNAIAWLQKQGEYPTSWKFSLTPTKAFKKEILEAELKYKVRMIPTLEYTPQGVLTNVAYQEIKSSSSSATSLPLQEPILKPALPLEAAGTTLSSL